MDNGILVALFNNAALLLVLSVIYDVVYFVPQRYRRLQPIFSGILISLICSIVMLVPFTLQSGIIFDTRSIIISVAALFFGLVPTSIVVAVTTIIRLFIGGSGTLAGVSVILASALIGLFWHHWFYPRKLKLRWLSIFTMSIIVHIVMLACMLLLPQPDNIKVIRTITIPVLLVYPAATVVLGLLLMRQQTLRNTQEQLKQSEERFKLLFEKATMGYQSLDFDGNFIDVNQQWCELLGYSRDEVIGKWFGDFLSPVNREAFRARFPVFKEQGFIHSEFEVLHKNGSALFIAFEGKIGYGVDHEFVQTHCILQDITNQKAAEAALIESEKKYRNIAENMSDVVWQADLDLKTTYISPSVQKLLGESPVEHMQRSLEEKFPEQTLKYLGSVLLEELENEKDINIPKNRSRLIEVEHYRADGTLIWIEMSIAITRNLQGNAIGIIGVSRDITQRKLAEIALKESERSKSVLLTNLPGMAYRCNYDRDWTMQFVSAGCEDLTGYAPESLINNRDLSYNDLITSEYRDPLWKEWKRVLQKRQSFQYEYEITTVQGERKWVLELGEGVFNEDGSIEALEGIIIDISDRKELENKLKYTSEHDALTGLYNTRYLEHMLDLDTKAKPKENRAVLSINLTEMNQVSIEFGFIYSQRLIRKIADELRRFNSDNCQLFHTHENRFAFYIKSHRDQEELEALCDDIAHILNALLAAERVGGGIGVVVLSEDTDYTAEQTLRNLMLASEKAIGNLEKEFSHYFYDAELEAEALREQAIEHDLSQIAADENSTGLFLQYQPILDLKSNTISGFEALARLRSDSYGQISPMEFIPIAEKTKLIIPLGYKIIQKALSFLCMLKDEGFEGINVSINISVVQLLKKDFVINLLSIINDMHINPMNIGIEVTESIFASNYQEINKILGGLLALGIKIAIDDFGTGYSSLSRERDMNISYLKIDQSFIKRLAYINDQKAITGDIISMAHRMGHEVIAEGVEQDIQLQYLRNHECDKIQGYLISKPLNEQAALKFLNRDR